MRADLYVLDAPVTAASGAPFPCRSFTEKWLQIGDAAGGTLTGSWNIEVTLDGVNWEVVANVTTHALVEIAISASSIRVTTVSVAAGTARATLAAHVPT